MYFPTTLNTYQRVNMSSSASKDPIIEEEEEEEGEEGGIQFKVVSPDMYEDVMDFLWTHFFPAEPISRSLGLSRHWLLDSLIWPDAFKHNCSLAALDSSGNILAVRVGSVKTRNSWGAWLLDKILENFPYTLASRFLSPFFQKMPILMKLKEQLDFDVWSKFDQWNCEAVYEVHNFITLMAKYILSAGFDSVLCQDPRHPRSRLRGGEAV